MVFLPLEYDKRSDSSSKGVQLNSKKLFSYLAEDGENSLTEVNYCNREEIALDSST